MNGGRTTEGTGCADRETDGGGVTWRKEGADGLGATEGADGRCVNAGVVGRGDTDRGGATLGGLTDRLERLLNDGIAGIERELELDDELGRRIEGIDRELEDELGRLNDGIDRELDERLGRLNEGTDRELDDELGRLNDGIE